MGKKFLLSAVLAAMLIDSSYAFEAPSLDTIASNIIVKDKPVENNATKVISAPNEVIVTFKENSNMGKIASTIKNIFSNATTKEYSLIKAMHIKIPGIAFDAIKTALKNSPFAESIKTIEPNYAYSYISTTNDTYYSKLWAIENTGQKVNGERGTNDADMDVKEAWNITKGDSDVVVAVLDTGVDYTHGDLADNMWNGETNHGYDFAGDNDGNNDDDPMPDTPYDDKGHYHGTHVAGTIGAVGNNSNGVTGVAQNVQIMAVKIFRPDGYGYSSDILEGLDYVSKQIDNGVKVVAINASYGGGGGSKGDSMDQAIQKLGDKGVVFCAAAGNDGKDIDSEPTYPASYSATNIITVAASDQDDELASFSNYGKKTVEVAAPGTNILSTYPDNQYAYLQGTSMATPNVTGTVALLASVDPSSSVSDRIKAIEENVDVKSSLKGKVSNGRVNTYKAVKALSNDSNNKPVANDDTATTKYETKVSIDVLANDSDSDGDKLTIKSVTSPKNGSVDIVNDKIEYTPNNGFSGNDSFTYTIDDGNGAEASATVTVSVKKKPNSAPVAKNDTASVDEDKSVLIDVLANDSDSDGDTLTIKSITKQPSHGKVETEDGKIKYTPNKNYNGKDSFEYKIADSNNAESKAKVDINIKAINDAPIAKDDTLTLKEDSSAFVDVLSNDSDVDGDKLIIDSLTQPDNGSVSIENGKVKYTPNSGFSGDDTFTYIVKDSHGAKSSASVNVHVKSEINHAPIAKDDKATTNYDTKVLINVLSNDSDVDGDKLSIKSISTPANGKAVIKNGKIEYTPNSAFSGSDSFKYIIKDTKGATSEATVKVAVKNRGIENHSPIAMNDGTFYIAQNKTSIIDVLSNDKDEDDGDSIKIKSVSQPKNGTVKIENNIVKYTPKQGFAGVDKFNYTIVDTNGATDSASVTLMVEKSKENGDTKEFVIPIIGDNGIEVPTKIIGEFINEIKNNTYIFKLKDNSGEIDVDKESGEVKLKNIKAPMPENKLPVGTVIKVEKNTLDATFKLTTNIKFK